MDAEYSLYCVNCGSAGGSLVLENEDIFRCIQQWTAPRRVEAHDLICTTCWSESVEHNKMQCTVGRNCVLCKKLLPSRKRNHQIIALRTDNEHHRNIRSIIFERLGPLEVRASHFICHPCWQRADRAAVHYSHPSTSRGTESLRKQLRCAACDIDLIRMRRYILSDESLLAQVQQHVTHQEVTANDYICNACHAQFLSTPSPTISSQEEFSVGHRQVCLGCGRSLLHQQHHIILEERNSNILHVVQNWIHPREVQASDMICNTCYRRAESRVLVPESDPNTNSTDQQPTERITLPNYRRAADTHARCMFPHCNSTTQRTVPFIVRVKLFSDYKYYVPQNCRVCELHLNTQPWSDLIESENPNHSFTASYIEDFVELLKHNNNTIDFENIEQMNDNLLRYYTGRTKDQFRQLELELPYFHKRCVALGAYLIKLRTGDSDERISTLLNISRSSLTKLIQKARDTMTQHFVPMQLGLTHISRQEVACRNKYIPESLFGNPGSAIEARKAIVMMDGTYIYVQKSTNYAYQKDTYSLHKYRNLIKPFIIVCCGGHILDVLGPYPATKSDADILIHEFSDASQPMRQYFREGDVMILDRCFRDSVSLLQSLNYSVHFPLSLEPGQTQMSTENANESRKVTLCRWVVEVVNGRFKRDFKLLRQEYFNRASGHLMQDFKVAAALINRFHPLLEDRDDARNIVSIIQEKMFLTNALADYVDQYSLNRRRSQFQIITVNDNVLLDFPRMEVDDLILISLGIYQIKQARSYYGEHVRGDGNYVIEVCRDVDQDITNTLQLNSENVWLLRGKIQSRHISRKIYFIYILIDNSQVGREAIRHYCCNCIVGRRTVGCCAHIMTIIWYLSWARYQNSVEPPAQFLDNILLRNIDNRHDDSNQKSLK